MIDTQNERSATLASRFSDPPPLLIRLLDSACNSMHCRLEASFSPVSHATSPVFQPLSVCAPRQLGLDYKLLFFSTYMDCRVRLSRSLQLYYLAPMTRLLPRSPMRIFHRDCPAHAGDVTLAPPAMTIANRFACLEPHPFHPAMPPTPLPTALPDCCERV